MRWLANLAMKGPKQAALTVLLLMIVPPLSILGGAVLALVVLCKGVKQSGLVILAAMIPAAFYALSGNIESLTSLLVIVLLAQLLKQTANWSMVVLAAAPISAVVVWFNLTYSPALREALLSILNQNPQIHYNLQSLMGVVAAAMFVQQILVLMLARWWQAGLHNPGGLRSELHQLQPKPLDLIGAGAMVLLASGLVPGFVPVALLPLFFYLSCKVHKFLFARGRFWFVLVLYYVLLVIAFGFVIQNW